MTDWTAYLDSVCEEYSQWWDGFTVMDVLDLEAERQSEEVRSPSEDKTWKVIEGLQNYAKDHVLLIGAPGSGKSTALRRLLLEIAQEVKEGKSDRIPVLVELRYGENSLLRLILNSLWERDPELDLDEKILDKKLRQGQFWLLLDGLNEIPSSELRSQLQNLMKFRPLGDFS
ncbi:MAG: NACHT domain-containing protein [Cyanobacteria bacterium SBLK]|nr:NACHT domain-containing protein [Cyanobacteria bacterium SBLK]